MCVPSPEVEILHSPAFSWPHKVSPKLVHHVPKLEFFDVLTCSDDFILSVMCVLIQLRIEMPVNFVTSISNKAETMANFN